MNEIAKKLTRQYCIREVQHKLAVKDVDMSKRIVTGMFSAFNNIDSDLDVIRPGSFKKSIQDRGPASSGKAKIKHLLFHDFTKIVGVPMVLKETEEGLYFETRMPDTTDGNDTLIKYQEQIYDNHSIGYKYVNGKIKFVERDDEDFERLLATVTNPEVAEETGYFYDITEVKLFEGSTVGIGANEETPYLGVKASDPKELKIVKAFDKIDILTNEIRNGKSSDASMIDMEAKVGQLKEFVRTLIENDPAGIKEFTQKRKESSTRDTASTFRNLL